MEKGRIMADGDPDEIASQYLAFLGISEEEAAAD
jgi:uncharacterized membrane protein